jgi:hypothetical protein
MKKNINEIINKVVEIYQNLVSYQDFVTCTIHNANNIDKIETLMKFKVSDFCFYYHSKDFSGFQGGALKNTIVGKEDTYIDNTTFLSNDLRLKNIDVSNFMPQNTLTKNNLCDICRRSNPIIDFLPFDATSNPFKIDNLEKEHTFLIAEEEIINNTICYKIIEKRKKYAKDLREGISKAFDNLPAEVSEIVKQLNVNYDEHCENITYWIDKQAYSIIKIEIETIDFPFIGSTNKRTYDITPIFDEYIDDDIFKI